MDNLTNDHDLRRGCRSYAEELLLSVRGKRHADGTVVITAVMMYVLKCGCLRVMQMNSM